MYEKGKKLDSKGIILACVGIIAVCIAINIAFAVFPPMGRSDDDSAVESSTATDGASDVAGDESSDVNAGMGPDGSDIPYWVIRAYFPNETEIPVTVDFTKGEGFNVGTY